MDDRIGYRSLDQIPRHKYSKVPWVMIIIGIILTIIGNL